MSDPEYARQSTMDDWLDGLTGEESVTVDMLVSAGIRFGRNSYPTLVAEVDEMGLLTPQVASRVVPDAWSSAEFPFAHLGADRWAELFDQAGYTVDGIVTARPTRPLKLWRGALGEGRDGWSWTDDREQAAWFAARPFYEGAAKVWVAKVPPEALLARITEARPGENEYVVDTRIVASTSADHYF